MTSHAAPIQIDQVPFERFRSGFPVLKRKAYLSVCDKMILHDSVRGAVDRFMDHLAEASANRAEHELVVVSSREKFAKLVNVAPSTIAAVRNVSDGINTVAWAMPMTEGDNVVVCIDAEHPNNIYPWLRQKRRGIELRLVGHNADGSLDLDAMIAAIDGRTKIVTCASVTFAPGHRTDLARLGEACRKRDVFLLVDGVQSAGILAHDFSSLPVDGFATSTSKGLLGLYGYGFLYVSPDWIDRLEPAYLSRPGVRMMTDDHSVMGGLEYEYQPDSRRFEVGSFNLAGAYAADAALDLLTDLGKEAIENRVLDLSAHLVESASTLGLKAAVPGSGPAQSHIVTFGALDAGGHGFSTDPMITPLSQRLAEANVVHSIRRGQLRFAVHAYNNRDDIDQTVHAIADVIKAK